MVMNQLPRIVLRGTVHVLWLACLHVPLLAIVRDPSVLAALGLLILAVTCALTLPSGKFWVFGAATALSIPLVAPVGPPYLFTWAWIGGAAAGFAPLLLTGFRRWVAAVVAVLVTAGVGFWVGGSPMTYGMIALSVGSTIIAMVGLPLWFATLLDQARTGREARARLAVSEERLRFARDVHDLLGHRLTVIALKAELAGRLADRDPTRSAAEAFAAQQLASTALAEVREAVDGYRAVDLPEQLDAVRNVLRDAGIRCELTRDEVTGEAATQLALAVREACTNVLRHSTATWCKISVVAEHGEVRMTVANDGAGPVREGNGLRGMGERLASAGGRVTTDRTGGVFTLQVVVPA